MRQPYRVDVPGRNGAMERARRSAVVLAESTRARTAGLRADTRGRFPELLHFRFNSVRTGQLDAHGWRPGRAAVRLLARTAPADAANGNANSPSLRRGLVGGGRVAWRAAARDRADSRRQPRRAVRRVPIIRQRLLFVVGYRELASSANHSRLRHEWAPAISRSRRSDPPLLTRQTRLQEREVPDRS